MNIKNLAPTDGWETDLSPRQFSRSPVKSPAKNFKKSGNPAKNSKKSGLKIISLRMDVHEFGLKVRESGLKFQKLGPKFQKPG